MDVLLSIGEVESLSGGKLLCRPSLLSLKGLTMVKADLDVELEAPPKIADELMMLGSDETVDSLQLVGEVLLLKQILV